MSGVLLRSSCEAWSRSVIGASVKAGGPDPRMIAGQDSSLPFGHSFTRSGPHIVRRRLVEPGHLDNHDPLATDVSQVAEHERSSLIDSEAGGIPVNDALSRKIIESRTVSSWASSSTARLASGGSPSSRSSGSRSQC
jgi:hypothetical protein